jgi:hypothetical protein
MLADGRELHFPPSLQLAFDFRASIAEGTIIQILTSSTTNIACLETELGRLGIGGAL